jgi:hypothetical protein
MSTRTKRFVVVLASVTALLVGALIVGLTPRSNIRGRLLDGSAVVLQKASYGTNYSDPEAPLEGMLRHLPAKWRDRIHWSPGSKRSGTSTPPLFTFWLRVANSNAANQSISYAIADQNGFESPMIFAGPYGSYSPGGFSRNSVGLIRGTCMFPRQSKKFFLRLYQLDANGERVRVAEFPVTNSGVQNSAHWKPENLPSEHQTNGFTFTLSKAEVGVSPPGPLIAPYNAQGGAWLELRFSVGAQGRRCADWKINEMFVSDESGKQLRVSAQDLGAFNRQFSRAEGDEIVCLHRWDFWADEPAWKFKIHFEQSTNNDCWIEYLLRPHFLNVQNTSAQSGGQPAASNAAPPRGA